MNPFLYLRNLAVVLLCFCLAAVQAETFEEQMAKAEQGDAMAQGYLGNRYCFGIGVPEDYVKAHMWYNLAAASGGPDDENRDWVAKRMTSSWMLSHWWLSTPKVRKRH
tara:strand:- start:7436 stop:7759 length:324 start_codon:yes stop_codon:yes gene_type:complete